MTNAVQEVWLPWPPTVNNLYNHGVVKGKIRRFPSPQLKKWKKAAHSFIQAARLRKYTEPVVAILRLTPGDSRPRDVDNYSKAIFDAFVEMDVIPGDDSRHLKGTTIFWENPNRQHAGVVVTLRPADMAGKTEPLKAAERDMLERWEKQPLRLVSPSYKPGVTMRALVAKGYIEELPGLIPDAPQAFRLRETDRA
jgi:crossover junction endodeoxyribonuclease RusA